MFIDLDDNNYNSINISSVKEIEKTEDGTTIYQVIITFKNGQQLIKSYNNKSDADAELEKILSAGPSGGGGGDLSNYYTKSESDANDAETLNSAKSYVDTEIGKLPAAPEFNSFVSTSNKTDVGRVSGGELNFSTLKPGLYHYRNYSSQESTGKFYFKYNTDDVPHTTSASTYTNIAYSELEVKILKDTSKGTKTLDTPIFAIVTFMDTSSYTSKSYRFYVNNSSTGNVSMSLLVNTPSSSGGQVYQHISTSSTNDFGKNSANAIDFTTLQKGTHIFKNVSTYNKLYYKYKKTSSSSYTSTSFTYGSSYSNSSQYSSYFIIEIFEDMSGGIYELKLDNGYNVALISVYVNNDYSKLVYSMVVSNKTTGTIDYGTRSNLASSSQLRNVYITANSASQESYQNTQSISALDTRVQALEKGGGGSGGGQKEYISDAAGTSYPPSCMWDIFSSNSFKFEKNTAEFKEGSIESIYVTLYPDQMHSDKVTVDVNYNYTSAMVDTSDVTIPNVTFKLYSTNDDSEISSINVGDVTLVYDSTSNKWKFNKVDVSFTYINPGNSVYCKMFYGGSSSSGVNVIKYSDLKIPQGSESDLFDYIANYNIDLNTPAFFLFDIPSGMPSISVQVNRSYVMITKGETYTLIKTETEVGSITYQYTIMQSINSRPDVRQFVIEYNDGMMHPTVTGGYTQFTPYSGN